LGGQLTIIRIEWIQHSLFSKNTPANNNFAFYETANFIKIAPQQMTSVKTIGTATAKLPLFCLKEEKLKQTSLWNTKPAVCGKTGQRFFFPIFLPTVTTYRNAPFRLILMNL